MFKLLSTFIALKLFTIVIRLLVEVIRWFWFEACVTNTTIYRHHNASVTINMTLILVNYSPNWVSFWEPKCKSSQFRCCYVDPNAGWWCWLLRLTLNQLPTLAQWPVAGRQKNCIKTASCYRAQLTVAFTRTSVALNTCTAALARSCRYTGSWYYRGWRPRYLWPPSSVTAAPHSTSVSPL